MKDLSSTFSAKGQLVVPVELRRKHGIQAGTKVKFLEDEFGRIVVGSQLQQHCALLDIVARIE